MTCASSAAAIAPAAAAIGLSEHARASPSRSSAFSWGWTDGSFKLFLCFLKHPSLILAQRNAVPLWNVHGVGEVRQAQATAEDGGDIKFLAV